MLADSRLFRMGLGAIPTPYPIIQQPSTDYATYRTPEYVYRLNLQAAQQQANRVNATESALGKNGYVTVDENRFNAWWNRFPGGPGVGQPPPQDFWIGVNPNDPFTNFIGAVQYSPILNSAGYAYSDADAVTQAQMLASMAASYANQTKLVNTPMPYYASSISGQPGYGTIASNTSVSNPLNTSVVSDPPNTHNNVGIGDNNAGGGAAILTGAVSNIATQISAYGTDIAHSLGVSAIPGWMLLAAGGLILMMVMKK